MNRLPRAAASAALALLAPAAAIYLGSGCGHSTEARSPYDQSASVPAPKSLAAALDPVGSVVLTWSASASDRAIVDGWTVERRATDSLVFEPLTEALLSDTTFTDLLAVDNVRYVYRVRGRTGAGIESAPAESPPVRADRIAPRTPAGLMITSRPAALEIVFTPAGDPDIALFEVRLVEAGGSAPPAFRPVAGSPAVLDGLTPGTTYGVSIAAIDSSGRQSPFSAPDVEGTPDPVPGGTR